MAVTRFLTNDSSTAKIAGGKILPINIIAPVISGSIGGTLSVDNGTWINGPVTYAYQWQYNGSAIPGATTNTFSSTSYTAAPVSVRVTATNADGQNDAIAYLTQGGGGPVLPTIMRQVTNRVSLPQSQNASFVMGRAGTQHWPAVAINGIVEVSWPLWLVVSGSAGPTNGGAWEYATGAATATAQITYTDRTTGLPVTVPMIDAVGGTTALSGVSGGEIVATAVIDMLPGTKIKPEIRGSFPSGVIYSQFKSDLAGGDFFEFANTVGALGSAPVQTFADTWYGPCMIRALSNKPVALISGDSREDGIYDVPNTVHGDGGQTARLLGEAGVPYLNLSARGDTAAEFAANTGNARRRALAAKAGATMIFLGNGINDFGQNRTSAQVQALNLSIADYFGLAAIWKTCDPFTVNNVSSPWSTSGNAERAAYNAAVRSKARYWDPTEILESASIPGAWVSAEAVYGGEQGIPTGALFIAATGNSGLSIRIRTGVSQFTYAVPSGFAAWN